MPENIGMPNSERRVSGNNASVDGHFADPIGTFNLRRRQYLNNTRYSGREEEYQMRALRKLE